MSSLNTHIGPSGISQLMTPGTAVFFIGIGGINMSSLALLTQYRGFRTGGSDRTQTELTDRLTAAGIEVFYSHKERHLDGYQVVVFTVAIPEDNPELSEARRRGLPCISRADYLGWMMTDYRNRIGICGMHGKSTCTSMCAQIFTECDTDPTVVSGAEMELLGGAYRIGGKDDFFLFEACEYMDSFLAFNPTAAVILNLEMDHPDYFRSMEQITESFARFAALTQAAGGPVIYNNDDLWSVQAVRDCRGDLHTFGMRSSAEYCAKNVKRSHGLASFDVTERGAFLCHVDLRVPGDHNIYNALGATAAARLYGLPGDKIGCALSHFAGAKRRMEYKGTWNGVDVYDDYGHHPTEVRTTLKAAKEMGYGKIYCVYQPHTYSRTAVLYRQFTEAFNDADVLLLVDIYAAREANVHGVSSRQLAKDVGEFAVWTPTVQDAVDYLSGRVRPGDLIIVMGAGNVNHIFPLMQLVPPEHMESESKK